MTPAKIAAQVEWFVSQWRSDPGIFVLVRTAPGEVPWAFYNTRTEMISYVDEDDEANSLVMSQLAALGVPVVDDELKDSFVSDRAALQPQDVVLFREYGVELRATPTGSLVLNVLCGRVGQFGVEFPLNHDERIEYQNRGNAFIEELSRTVQANSEPFVQRGRAC